METSNFLSLLKGIKKSGPASWTALCPSHPDKQRSLSVSAGRTGVLVKCFAGCEPKNITDALGLELPDLFFDNGGNGSLNKSALRPSTLNKATPVSPTPNDATRRKPVTICELAADKKLPEDFLRNTFKMTDSADGVVIPYLNPDGSAFRERLRTTLKAGDGSRWLAGSGQTVYGLHLLGLARELGYAIFVEGESDTWTAHYHGFPTLGIPGAEGVKVVKYEHLEGLPRVFYVREPDKGGDTFAAKLPAHLRAIGFTGPILEIRLPGAKDLSELNLQNELGFKAILTGLLESALAAPETDKGKVTKPQAETVKTVCFADIAPETIAWLWFQIIALGKLTLLVGDPGLGKSLISLFMAAKLSRGAAWPNGAKCPMGNAIFITCEDDPADTIRPRLDAAGADVSKIHIVTAVCNADGKEKTFTLDNIPALEETITRLNPGLIVIDPISAYMGGSDSHNNAEVRSVLAPLSELAAKYKVAIVAVSHLNKGTGPAMYRAMGSLAFTAAARAVWAVVKDKDDPDRRLVLPVKNNIGNDTSGLAYRVATAANGSPCLEWEPGPVNVDVAEAMAVVMTSGGDSGERQEAKVWLIEYLSSGGLPAKDVEREAKDAGFSLATLRRAKQDAGIKSVKASFGSGWIWTIPEDAHETSKTLTPQRVNILGKDEHLGEPVEVFEL